MVQAMGATCWIEIDTHGPGELTARAGQAAMGGADGDRGRGALFRVLRQPGRHGGGPVDPAGRGLFRLHPCTSLMACRRQIIPWNYPLEMTARSLSAALATGNACVIKTPELTPLSSHLCQGGRGGGLSRPVRSTSCAAWGPRGGGGAVAHRGREPDRLHRLGVHGHRHRHAAAANVVPCVLELGGKSAAIVHEDADLDAFETDIRWGIYFNARPGLFGDEPGVGARKPP
jgi:aldehyde dehydrogenase (NAD+)